MPLLCPAATELPWEERTATCGQVRMGMRRRRASLDGSPVMAFTVAYLCTLNILKCCLVYSLCSRTSPLILTFVYVKIYSSCFVRQIFGVNHSCPHHRQDCGMMPSEALRTFCVITYCGNSTSGDVFCYYLWSLVTFWVSPYLAWDVFYLWGTIHLNYNWNQ